jgi:serine/threonine-protein kinase HipA
LIGRRYGVWLGAERVGVLNQRGDYVWFVLEDGYVENPRRSVLGLVFEENLYARHSSALRLPPWFSNLLPEGQLRQWIADTRGVSVDREMELLAQVGRDLPGAVRIFPEDEPPEPFDKQGAVDFESGRVNPEENPLQWRFSLAGVGLKFSMVRQGDRLTLPAHGEGGDWIVKLPDPEYAGVPLNEYSMMMLARLSGIDVPETRLVHRDQLDTLPPQVWQTSEELAYSIRRFDRLPGQGLIHIEDFAQVRNVWPYGDGKYRGSYETVAAIAYRFHDVAALEEFARRLTFNVLISNGDAHLKNWSLIYYDKRVPTISPAYDIVSTAHYNIGGPGVRERLALKFNRSDRFEQVDLAGFDRLQAKLNVESTQLRDIVVQTIDRVREHWPQVADSMTGSDALRASVAESIELRAKSILTS